MPVEPYHDGLRDILLDGHEVHRQPQYAKPSADDRPGVLRSAFHEVAFVTLIAMAAASSVFLQRSMVVIAADIADALDTSPAGMAWSTAASGLATGALLIPFGHLADINVVPKKTFLLLSLAAFALLVALTSFSPDGIVLDVMAGLAGAACAANIPAAVGLLSLVYPHASRRKNIAFSSFLMGSPAATILGGLVSGELASAYGWKTPFAFLAALYAAITILSWIFVPNVPRVPCSSSSNTSPGFAIEIPARTSSLDPFLPAFRQRKSNIWSPLVKFDWAGALLLLAGTLLFAENATKTPMLPHDIWEDWNLVMKVERFTPFDVAVRLLPQALMGLFFSPLVGLLMHKVSGTAILVTGGFFSVVSNILLIFLRPGSSYFLWIFPSLLLSTVGMDWTMNVGSLFILSSLPLKHHSIGGSLLQTTARLGIPLGLAITTAVWSSFNEKGGIFHPELPYSKVFVTTTAFAGFSLLIAPLIRIGKQGNSVKREGVAKQQQQQQEPLSPEQVVWVICERCGCGERQIIRDVGDPVRYFDDVDMKDAHKPGHETTVHQSTKRFSWVSDPRHDIGIAA
ncbi:hypothetical protein PG987_002609 [Apiospora arundinis]|uniref:Major facilitator superfamily domain-containing protein n=1 Tax=Apiospora arundinis TaxID=335852 RepID=A0ABR2J9P3_9PEZI